MIIIPSIYPINIVKTNTNSWHIVTFYTRGWQHNESSFGFDELKQIATDRLVSDIQALEKAIEFKKENLRLVELLEEDKSDYELAQFIEDFRRD